MTIHNTNQSKYKCGVTTCSALSEVLLSAGWSSSQPAGGAAYKLSSLGARGSIAISLYETSGLSVKVESGNRSRTWALPSPGSGYHVLANPYGIFLAPVDQAFSGSAGYTTHGLFASTPYVEDGIETSAISSCVLLVQINGSLGVGTTQRSFLWFNDTELTDSDFVAGDTAWGVMQWQHFGMGGLLTTMGHSIKTPAALFLPYAGSVETLGACSVRRAGYFWDSIVVSEYLPRGRVVQQDGSSWMVTLSQKGGDPASDTSIAGAILWRIDEEL